MTRRERFQKTLDHTEPDRVPIDAGQDLHNGIHELAYRNLLSNLGERDDVRIYDRMQHLAAVKESVLARLHVDTRYLFAQPGSGYRSSSMRTRAGSMNGAFASGRSGSTTRASTIP